MDSEKKDFKSILSGILRVRKSQDLIFHMKNMAQRLVYSKSAHTFKTPMCKLCSGSTAIKKGYGRIFFQCEECRFVFATDYEVSNLNKGMGMEGSWSGPGGGGYREYYLVKLLIQEFGFKSFLLYGTGNTETFANLRKEGIDVVGCDVCLDVVNYKKRIYGDDSFFTPETLPANKKYDGIIAVEVFEHFGEPRLSLSLLMGKLNPEGVICGTTDFFPGDTIEDSNNPGFMSHRGHVAYWNIKSMSCIARDHNYRVAAFEMIRPGSVLPDERYGQLWPNKRVFFIYNPKCHSEQFDKLLKTTPILPIDKP